MRYWEPPARIVVYSTSLILTEIFFFAKVSCAMVLGFAEGSGLLYLPLPYGWQQRGAARANTEREHNGLSRAGPSDRKGNRPFSYFPLTKTKDCSQGLTHFPKLYFSMDNCHSPACTDSIKVFLGNPPKDSAQWTTQLFIHCLGMICLNQLDCFWFFSFLWHWPHTSQLPECS